MYILHIETSTQICSLAISHEKELVGSLDLAEGMNHTALLAPAIDRLLKSTSLRPKDLAAISVSSGPGSYTGLRVGSSTAKAMAYSLHIPILAIPTLLSLAKAALDRHPGVPFIMPMMDARRNEVYTALFDTALNIILPDSSLILEKNTLAEIIPQGKDIVFCGDGSRKLGFLSGIDHVIIDLTVQCKAANLVIPAWEKFSSHQLSDPLHHVPFYLKPPNITQQKKVP